MTSYIPFYRNACAHYLCRDVLLFRGACYNDGDVFVRATIDCCSVHCSVVFFYRYNAVAVIFPSPIVYDLRLLLQLLFIRVPLCDVVLVRIPDSMR